MNVIEIKDLLAFESHVFSDDSGWFIESFNQSSFEQALAEHNLPTPQFVQNNPSASKKGVIRGLYSIALELTEKNLLAPTVIQAIAKNDWF